MAQDCGPTWRNHGNHRPCGCPHVLGIILAVLGLFVAANVILVVIGLLSIFGAGILQVAGGRG